MNTRLQVEHPITEIITGYDLVEWQIRVASGETLPVKNQRDINKPNGHAIECRIYAENPYKDFLPATGNLQHLVAPSNARVDTGVRQGDDISVYYDPMISKLIVHGDSRKDAILQMMYALRNYQIVGVTTNIPFLLKCAQHPVYQKGDGLINTNFLVDYANDLHLDDNMLERKPSLTGQALFALYILLRLEKRVGVDNLLQERKNQNPWSSLYSSWSIHGSRIYTLHFANHDNDDDVTIIHAVSNSKDGSFHLNILNQDKPIIVNGTLTKDGLLTATVNEKRLSVTTFCQSDDDDNTMSISLFASNNRSIGKEEEYSCYWSYLPNHEVHINQSNTKDTEQSGTQKIKSPMPGKVIQINTSLNDVVQSGDVLIMLEAMKMEHAIHANASGVVSMLDCNVGDIVKDGSVLAMIESSHE